MKFNNKDIPIINTKAIAVQYDGSKIFAALETKLGFNYGASVTNGQELVFFQASNGPGGATKIIYI